MNLWEQLRKLRDEGYISGALADEILADEIYIAEYESHQTHPEASDDLTKLIARYSGVYKPIPKEIK